MHSITGLSASHCWDGLGYPVELLGLAYWLGLLAAQLGVYPDWLAWAPCILGWAVILGFDTGSRKQSQSSYIV
jgi:prepilin signal peptidase PulO-like enzyme (type II secretory pathway)